MVAGDVGECETYSCWVPITRPICQKVRDVSYHKETNDIIIFDNTPFF